MAQIVRLSETYWISLDQIICVLDEGGVLHVTSTVTLSMEDGKSEPLMLYLKGEERASLLTILARTSATVNPNKS